MKLNGSLLLNGVQTKQSDSLMSYSQTPKSLGFYRLKGINTNNHKSLGRHEAWDQGHFYYKQIRLINQQYNKTNKVSTIWSSVCLILFVIFGIAFSNYVVHQNKQPAFNHSLYKHQ